MGLFFAVLFALLIAGFVWNELFYAPRRWDRICKTEQKKWKRNLQLSLIRAADKRGDYVRKG